MAKPSGSLTATPANSTLLDNLTTFPVCRRNITAVQCHEVKHRTANLNEQ
jgi:hypothetical protein